MWAPHPIFSRQPRKSSSPPAVPILTLLSLMDEMCTENVIISTLDESSPADKIIAICLHVIKCRLLSSFIDNQMIV